MLHHGPVKSRTAGATVWRRPFGTVEQAERQRAIVIKTAVTAAPTTTRAAAAPAATDGVTTNSRRYHGVMTWGAVCGIASMMRDSRLMGVRMRRRLSTSTLMFF